jgi:hypothetical protein
LTADLDDGLRADFFGADATAARFDLGAGALARTLACGFLADFAVDRTDFLARLTAMLTSWVSISGTKRDAEKVMGRIARNRTKDYPMTTRSATDAHECPSLRAGSRAR